MLHGMPTRHDACPYCGDPKDIRAEQCRECWEALQILQPFRWCAACECEHPADQFPMRHDGSRMRGSCRDGEAKKAREWRATNPGRHAQAKRDWARKHPERHARGLLRRAALRLRLDADAVLAHFDAHNGLCDVCAQPDGTYKRLAIDHCHHTGAFRGLLCGRCNKAIGLMSDEPERLRRAAGYLEAAHAQPILSRQTGPIPASMDSGSVSSRLHTAQRPNFLP